MGRPEHTTTARAAGNGFVRVSAAARLLDVSVSTLRRWSDAGRVRAHRSPGGHRVYDRRELELLRARKRGAAGHNGGRPEEAATGGGRKSRDAASPGPLRGNGRRPETLRRLRERGRVLHEIVELAVAVSNDRDLDHLGEVAARDIARVLDVDLVDVYVFETASLLRCVCCFESGSPVAACAGTTVDLAAFPLTREAALKDEVTVIADPGDQRLTAAERADLKFWGARSELLIPLVAGSTRLGLIDAFDSRPRDFAEHLEFMAMVGRVLAGAMAQARLLRDLQERSEELASLAADNATLVETLRRGNEELAASVARQEEQARRLTSLLDASRAITSTIMLDDVLDTVARTATATLGTHDCTIWEYDGQADTIVGRTYFGPDPGIWTNRGVALSLADYPGDRAIIENGVVVEERLSDPGLDPATRKSMLDWNEQTILTVPLMSAGGCMGLLTLSEQDRERHFDPAEIELARALGEQAAVAIHNAKLYELQEEQNRELARAATRLALVNETSIELSSTLDPRGVLTSTAKRLTATIGVPDCDVYILSGDGHLDCLASVAGGVLDEGWMHRARSLSVGDWSPMQIVMESRRPAVLRSDDPRLSPQAGAALREYRQQALLAVPLIANDEVIGSVELLDHSADREFDGAEIELVESICAVAALAIHNARLYDEIKGLHLGNLKGLSTALTAKDYYTLGHAARVATYAVLLGHELGWSREFLEQVEEAAYLHDIGKIGVSDRVLLKQGPLNPEEWALMRDHPAISADILHPLFDDRLVLGVRHHHERFDGSGYPDGLAGEDVPPLARALGVVDSYDAMSLQRPYRGARTHAECLKELGRCAGTQFDPAMVAAFERVLGRLAERRAWAASIAAEGAALVDPAQHALLRDPEDQRRAEYEATAQRLRDLRDAHPPVRYITTQVERDGKYVIIVDAEEEDSPEHSRLGEEVKADEELPLVLAGTRSEVNVIFADTYGVWAAGLAPLRDEAGRIVGAVEVDIPALDIPGLTSRVKQPATSMLGTAASRLSRAEIDAITDGLTGLYNHRYLHDRLGEEIERARAEGSRLTLLFCDLDRFKDYNDRLGHSTGDRALRSVARVIEDSVRRVDLVARYGGEEFCVVLMETDSAAALEVAERIRAGVAAESLKGAHGELTISIGVATFPDDADSKEELLDKADWSMYRAKRHGRDRVVAFTLEDAVATAERITHTASHGYLALMAEVVEARDVYATKRGAAVAHLAAAVAEGLDLCKAETEVVVEAARLCDIGEIGVPEHVLNKPAPLSEDEWALVREHPLTGERLLRHLGGSEDVARAIAAHHERFDGSGYPAGLGGERIPAAARIVAVACAYNAMVAERPYRPRLSENQALEELRRCSGTQFDPQVVEALAAVLRDAG